MGSLYILNISLLSDIWFANVLSHHVGRHFTSLMISFAVQKLVRLMSSHLLNFYFVACASLGISKKSLPRSTSGRVPKFPSGSSVVSEFPLVFNLPELVLGNGVKHRSYVILLPGNI